ncbi:MAG: class I tRNA ligase family protein, partial [Bacteroidota bacterium]
AAIRAVIQRLEEMKIGKGCVNFRLRDAIFSRQRYWGEPFPVYYRDGIPCMMELSQLPLELPEVDKYLPTESGDPPLARAANWKSLEGYPLETSTMPGFAGSSGYYLRYMDPRNDQEYFSRKAVEYWQDVDLYIGGAEHATGHLIYSRFWNKFLYDLGFSVKEEPFKKLINQGMIQGVSQKARVYYSKDSTVGYIFPQSVEFSKSKEPTWTPIPVEFVDGSTLTKENLELLKNTYKHLAPLTIATFEDARKLADEVELEGLPEDSRRVFVDQSVLLRPEVEKMSKSKYNVVNPDDLIVQYGADTLRLYEMFLGPLEQSKPWDTKGIEGVFRFMRKFWRLYHDRENEFLVTDETPSKEELKVLHKTIKRVREDFERFSFNTVVSTFMICVNELSDLKCNKRAILEPLTILISPFAPHIAEELWRLLGHNESVSFATFPEVKEEYLIENTFSYPVSFNGKMRFIVELPLDMIPSEVEKVVLAAPESQKWLLGNPPKKVIVVPGKIVNVVL